MKAYKGFNKDMTCRGFQFEEGKTYEEKEAILCEKGFHACINPIDVFCYYSPVDSVYHNVELEEISAKRGKDSKICGKKIKIGAKLTFDEMIRAGVEIDIKSAKKAAKTAASGDFSPVATSGDSSHAATSGNYSHAVTSGNSSYAATSGDSSHAATSGNYSHAATSGNYSYAATSGDSSSAATSGISSPAATSGKSSSAATSGDLSHAVTSGNYSPAVTSGKCSHAVTSGDSSIAAAIGRNSKAKSTIGNWIVLAEYGEWNGKTYPVLCVKCGKIDGVSLKSDTYYQLENGEFVEVEE